MRGQTNLQGAIFHYFQPEDLMPADHPLRRIKTHVETALLSDEHFSVDGTLIEAWASQKSLPPTDRRPASG